MARVHRHRVSSAAPAASRHKLLTNRKKPSYKVVLEQVTQERKKLITVVCGLTVCAEEVDWTVSNTAAML